MTPCPVQIEPPESDVPFTPAPQGARAERFVSRDPAAVLLVKAKNRADTLVAAAEAMLQDSGFFPRSLQAAIEGQVQIARWLRSSLGKLPHNHPLARQKVVAPPFTCPVQEFLGECATQDTPEIAVGVFSGYAVTWRAERRHDDSGWIVTVTARKDGQPTAALQSVCVNRKMPTQMIRAIISLIQ